MTEKELFSGLKDDSRTCAECGGALVFKSSKSGSFLACSNYPQCNFIRKPKESSVEVLKVFDEKPCPKCQSPLALKKGKFGMFIGCSGFPACDFIQKDGDDEDESISCPECNSGKLVERTAKGGRSFYACSAYPKCQYAVNYPPVNEQCPSCSWPILIKRKKSGLSFVECPQSKCGYRSEV